MTDSAGQVEEQGYDPLKEARAYNNSILFMLSVPYVVMGFFGVYVYRCVGRAKADAAAAPASMREPWIS